jgi:GNAT superfamily N-acetyltransferase
MGFDGHVVLAYENRSEAMHVPKFDAKTEQQFRHMLRWVRLGRLLADSRGWPFRCIVRIDAALAARRFFASTVFMLDTMGIAIRQATLNDATAACTLLRRSIEECCAPDHRHQPAVLDSWLGNKTPQNVAAWLAVPANHVLVAERDGALQGLALLTQAGKVSLFYVLPEALRSGVGRALLAAVEAQARAWNIGKLYLHSPASASAFFERHGFTNAGRERSCFGLDCEFLWKRLGEVPAAPDAAASKRFCHCSGT